MKVEEAESILEKVHPDPLQRPSYHNPDIDNNIDLSIIVPVFNYVDLIKTNIDSILNQKTKYHFELIIIDDGSTDGSRDIVLNYQDLNNVKVICHENGGIAAARNTGIDHASGRYLMFVDCDDIVHDDIVETLMEKAYEDDCDIVMCAHNLSKERNGQIYNNIPNVYPEKNLLHYKNDDEIMNYAGLPWGKVYKRELWNQVRFFPGYWYEDTIIHFLLFTQCKKFAYVPKICYEYRWYEKNYSHTQGSKKNNKSIDRYYLLKAIIEQYEFIGLPNGKMFYTLLVKHLSTYYYSSISGLDTQVIHAMLIMANELLKKYHCSCKMPLVLKDSEKAILTRDLNIWKLSSRFQ